jgi:hypothetical protein
MTGFRVRLTRRDLVDGDITDITYLSGRSFGDRSEANAYCLDMIRKPHIVDVEVIPAVAAWMTGRI